MKQYGLDSDGRIALYIPHTQAGSRAMYVTVRTSRDPSLLAASVKAEIRAIDPDLPVYRVRPMAGWVDQSLARPRFAMTLLAGFAALALVLAALGVYGVTAFLVSQSTRDLGIRIALGASEGAVLGWVVRQGLRLALSGALVGLVAAMTLSRLIESLLFGVGGTDPATFLGAILLLIVVALAAAYFPARRAARTDPVESLRME